MSGHEYVWTLGLRPGMQLAGTYNGEPGTATVLNKAEKVWLDRRTEEPEIWFAFELDPHDGQEPWLILAPTDERFVLA